MRVLALLIAFAACAPAPTPPVPVTRDRIIGAWTSELPNHETYLLMLFDSGIAAFIHANPKLPISSAYGRWSFDDGTLDLHMVGEHAAAFPLANRFLVQKQRTKLVFSVEGIGETSVWAPHDRYGAAREGAADRAIKDEREWTLHVEAAERVLPTEL